MLRLHTEHQAADRRFVEHRIGHYGRASHVVEASMIDLSWQPAP
jgi:hypothetical protein